MKGKADNTSSLDILTAIRERSSVRAFLKRPVPLPLLWEILDTARFAPSGVNTQPWHVAIVGPKHRKRLSEEILQAKESHISPNPDYHYYPKTWEEPYKSRRKACGLALYNALSITGEDTEKRKAQWYQNYEFFQAPAAFLFYLERSLCQGSWLDMGMFLQNVMLAARAHGLETCPQAAFAEYPEIIRKCLALEASYAIVCGMAIGYADWSHPINQYRTERIAPEQFAQYYD